MNTVAAAVPILLYHSVVAEIAASPFAVTRRDFARHLELVRASGRTPMTVTGYVDARRTGQVPERPVLVTFDDGCADFIECALPELEAAGIDATMYLVSGLVGGSMHWTGVPVPLMNWEQLRSLPSAGIAIELGAHSIDHPQLDILPVPEAERQIRLSKEQLEDGLGLPIRSFAYPHGHHSPAVRQLVIDAGYDSGAAVKNRLSPSDDDAYALARVTITADFGDDRLVRLLDGQGAVAASRQQLRTVGFRAYRKARSRLRSGAR